MGRKRKKGRGQKKPYQSSSKKTYQAPGPRDIGQEDTRSQQSTSREDPFLEDILNAQEETVGKVHLEYDSKGHEKVKRELKDTKKHTHELGKEFEHLQETIKEGVVEAFHEMFGQVTKAVLGFFSVKKALGSTIEAIQEVSQEVSELGLRFGSLASGEHAMHFVSSLSKQLPLARKDIVETVMTLKSLNFQLSEIESLPLQDIGMFAAASGQSMKSLLKDVEDLTRSLDISKAYDIARTIAEQGLLRPGEDINTVVKQVMGGLRQIQVRAGQPIYQSKQAFESILRSLNVYYGRARESAEHNVNLALQRLQNSFNVIVEAVIGKAEDANSPLGMIIRSINSWTQALEDESSWLHHFFETLGHMVALLAKTAVPFLTPFALLLRTIGAILHVIVPPLEWLMDTWAGKGLVFMIGSFFALKMMMVGVGGMIGFLIPSFQKLLQVIWMFGGPQVKGFMTVVLLQLNTVKAKIVEFLSSGILLKFRKALELSGLLAPTAHLPTGGATIPSTPGTAGPTHLPKEGLHPPPTAGARPGPAVSPTTPPATSKAPTMLEQFNTLNTKNLLAASGAIIAISGSLWIFAKALQEFAKVDKVWQSIGLATASLIMLGAAMYGIMAILSSFSLALPIVAGGLMILVAVAGSMLAMAYAFSLTADALNSFATGLQKIADLPIMQLLTNLNMLSISFAGLLFTVGNPLSILSLLGVASSLERVAGALERMSASVPNIAQLPTVLQNLSSVDLSGMQAEQVAVATTGGSGNVYNIYINGYIQSLDELKRELDRLDNKTKRR